MEQWNFLEMIIRSTMLFSILLLFTRLMGRKQLSQLTYFNYITGIALGSIAANTTLGKRSDLLDGVTSLIWWALLTIIVGLISLQSKKFRLTVDGQPVIVIKKGNIIKKELKKLRLNMDDLTMLLRQQKVFSMQEVEYAIFEPTGKLSVLLKENNQPVTKKDQNLPTSQSVYLPTQVISDGEILYDHVKTAGITSEWLKQQLKQQNLHVENVFYAELQTDGTLYIDQH